MAPHVPLGRVSTQLRESLLPRAQGQEGVCRHCVPLDRTSDSPQVQLQPTNGLCLAHTVSFFLLSFLIVANI